MQRDQVRAAVQAVAEYDFGRTATALFELDRLINASHGDTDALFRALAEMTAAPETFTDNIAYARDRLDTFSPERQIAAMERLIRLLTGS